MRITPRLKSTQSQVMPMASALRTPVRRITFSRIPYSSSCSAICVSKILIDRGKLRAVITAGLVANPGKEAQSFAFQRLACFWRSVSESAIMAMNSLLVGFPLMFDTV